VSDKAHIGFETRHGTILTKITRIMKRYYVSVTETLNKIVSVDAKSEKDALEQVQTAYNDSVIVLDSSNFVNEEIELDSNQELYADNEKEQGGDVYQHID
jgi:hypothetical protein